MQDGGYDLEMLAHSPRASRHRKRRNRADSSAQLEKEAMNIRTIERKENGAVLLTTTLVVFSVAMLLVVGYFWLIMGQGRAVERSQTWNRAMTVAEAGVEEA